MSVVDLQPNCAALASLETPALVVDEAALRANIAHMSAFARDAGVALRPHVKTHKSVAIAKMQTAAGALGLSCATISELAALNAAGLPGLLLTSPVADRMRARRLVALHRRSPVLAVVDHPLQAQWLHEALEADDPTLDLLIDVDVGQKRTGVRGPAEAVALARSFAGSSHLRLRGVQGFGGQIQHIIDARERRDAAACAGALIANVVQALRGEGASCDIVSGSGTGASAYDAQGPYTELQVGSYVFMDADYRRLRAAEREEGDAKDDGLPYKAALFVLASVVSVNHSGQVTVDAGVKALAFNGPPPDRMIGAPPGSRFQFAGDEHGVIVLPPGAASLPLGGRVLIAATHCDPTVNLHAAYVIVSPDGSVAREPLVGRYA